VGMQSPSPTMPRHEEAKKRSPKPPSPSEGSPRLTRSGRQRWGNSHVAQKQRGTTEWKREGERMRRPCGIRQSGKPESRLEDQSVPRPPPLSGRGCSHVQCNACGFVDERHPGPVALASVHQPGSSLVGRQHSGHTATPICAREVRAWLLMTTKEETNSEQPPPPYAARRSDQLCTYKYCLHVGRIRLSLVCIYL
jgi:hypothetical protein